MDATSRKQSYTIPCSSTFRDAVSALARQRRVNVADLARSVLLMLPTHEIDALVDPGEPPADDRETVILKSGPSEGRPWRRKPRLQVRMAPGYDPIQIRRALGLVLAMARSQVAIRLHDPAAAAAAAREPAVPAEPVSRPRVPPRPDPEPDPRIEEIERLRAMISALAFDPLPGGVNTRAEALHILGFPPGQWPDSRTVRSRFRMLATIHHPDGEFGNHQRMSQLNAAMDILRRPSL